MISGPPATITRRHAIGAAVGVGSLLAVGACVVPDSWPGITVIGDNYRAAAPADAELSVLQSNLGHPAPGTTPGSLLTAHAPAVTSDYLAGRVVWLSTCVISITEARIAALWALRPDRA